MTNAQNPDPTQDVDDVALHFLEAWISSPQSPPPAPLPEVQRTIDPSLRAIERLVAQHQDLFRRHTPSRSRPLD